MSLNDCLLVSAQRRPIVSIATFSGSKALAMVALGVTLAVANEVKPQFGAWGYDAAGADVSTKAGNDFFRYANGAWLDKTEIPADKPGVSLRLAMTDLIEERLRHIMEQASPGDLEGKVGAFYRTFMNEALIDALRAKPLGPDLALVRDATTSDQLAALMGLSNSHFAGSLFNISIDVDLKDPNHYAVYVGQAGLGLPDRDYYVKGDFAAVKDATCGVCEKAWPAALPRFRRSGGLYA